MNVAALEQCILDTWISDMEKSTSRNPLLLLISCKFSLPIVGLKIHRLFTVTLKSI
jgi:hypothetical protein